MAGEARGVVRRVADHREHRTGRGVECDHGAALVAERLLGGRLRLGVDGELEAGPALLPSGEDVGHAAVEELVGRAGEQAVLGRLDATAGPEHEREVPGDVGVAVLAGVRPQPLQLVVRRHRLRHRRAVDEDLAALAGIAREQGAAVLRALLERLRLDEGDERRGHEQRTEQQRDDRGEASDGGVHRTCTTSVRASLAGLGPTGTSATGRRAWSLMRRSSATRDQFASSEDPP